MNADQKAAQHRVVRSALRFARSGINEQAGSNSTIVNHWWEAMFGWGDDEPWCAMTVSEIGAEANTIHKEDMSAGAWALSDHMHSKGLGLKEPEPGCGIAYGWGTGHTETCVKVLGGGYVWAVGGNTGSGAGSNEGDGCYLVKRYLPGNLYHNPFWRHPGVQHGWKGNGALPNWWDHRFLFNRAPSHLLHDDHNHQAIHHIQRIVGVKVDGHFGPGTAEALKHWQHRHGLVADGAFHISTAHAMRDA